MKRFFIKITSAFVFLLVLFPVNSTISFAATDTDSNVCGDNLVWSINESSELTITGTGEMYDFSIDSSPWNKQEILKVTIEDGVTSIGKYAFSKSNLEEITIPDSVTSIGRGAFSYCSKLTEVKLPEFLSEISYGLFEHSSVAQINIPSNVKKIDNYAFYGCDFSSIEIPMGVKRIGEYSFMYCSELLQITIPDSVTEIDKSAFYQCQNLSKVTIGSGLKDIYSSTFQFCKSLTEVLINSEIKNIYDQAFASCDKLEKILIPDSLEQIHNTAFANCKSLKEIDLPDSLKYISDYAFRFCDSLETVIIGKNIQTIGNCAFDGCENLSQVHYRGKLEDWNVVEIGTDNEPLVNSKFCFANEKSSTALDKNGNPFLTVSCDSDFFVDNPDKTFVAKIAGIADSNVVMNNSKTAVYKLNLYVADASNIENKVSVTGNFTVKLPIPSSYKNCTITVLHWITGEAEPEYISCTPFWDEDQGEYCIKFETTSFSQFDICINFGFEQESTEVFNDRTYALSATTDENVKVIYTSSNPDIVTVDEYGNITTHGRGTANITARAEELGEEFVDTCTVTVVNSFEIPENILELENLELIYKNTSSIPATADEGVKVTYTSSNPKVVTVDENGNITTQGKGTATITATIVDNFGEEYTDTCEVTVKFTFWQWIIYILFLEFLWY